MLWSQWSLGLLVLVMVFGSTLGVGSPGRRSSVRVKVEAVSSGELSYVDKCMELDQDGSIYLGCVRCPVRHQITSDHLPSRSAVRCGEEESPKRLLREWLVGVERMAGKYENAKYSFLILPKVGTLEELFLNLPRDGHLDTKLQDVYYTQSTVSMALLDVRSGQEYDVLFMRCAGVYGDAPKQILLRLVNEYGVSVKREGRELSFQAVG